MVGSWRGAGLRCPAPHTGLAVTTAQRGKEDETWQACCHLLGVRVHLLTRTCTHTPGISASLKQLNLMQEPGAPEAGVAGEREGQEQMSLYGKAHFSRPRTLHYSS